jgi:hypothetical protein
MAGLNREVTINSLPYIKKEIVTKENKRKWMEISRSS